MVLEAHPGAHILKWAPLVNFYRSVGFMAVTMVIAQACARWHKRALPRHVPLIFEREPQPSPFTLTLALALTYTFTLTSHLSPLTSHPYPRHVPLIITSAVVLSCLAVLLLDWAFSQVSE